MDIDINETKIYEFFNKNFIKQTSEISILKQDEGVYELFGKYFISGSKQTGYKVEINHNLDPKNFFMLRNAVTWCIFDKRNKIRECQRIEHLDKALDSIRVMIDWHKNLAGKSKDTEYKLVYLAKLSYDEGKRRILQKELANYILDAKIWQNSRFANNT